MLNEVFDSRTIKMNLAGKTKIEAFNELIEMLAEVHSELDKSKVLEAIEDREGKMNTALASGVALPHGYYHGMAGVFGAIGISSCGIDYGAPDNKPVHCIFLLVMGDSFRENHLRVLTRVMRLVNSEALSQIQKAKTADDITKLIARIS